MDPQSPESFAHEFATLATGRRYHFVDQVPEHFNSQTTPTLLLLHGFPDLWYGWRYQIGPWVQRGYRVVVPDMLGYGGTDKPSDAAEYSTKKLCADLVALLDYIHVERAVVIGHDWGSFVAGRFALWHPSRLMALVILSVPFTPPTREYVPIEEVVKKAPNLSYQAYFASEGSTNDVDSNLAKFMRFIFQNPVKDPGVTISGLRAHLSQGPITEGNQILNDKEFDYYLGAHKQGMQGPLNYYRTSKHRFEEEREEGLPTNVRADIPALFLWGTLEPTVVPQAIANMKKFIPRLQDAALENRGHWLMMEAQVEVTERIAHWLRSVELKAGADGSNL